MKEISLKLRIFIEKLNLNEGEKLILITSWDVKKMKNYSHVMKQKEKDVTDR